MLSETVGEFHLRPDAFAPFLHLPDGKSISDCNCSHKRQLFLAVLSLKSHGDICCCALKDGSYDLHLLLLRPRTGAMRRLNVIAELIASARIRRAEALLSLVERLRKAVTCYVNIPGRGEENR